MWRDFLHRDQIVSGSKGMEHAYCLVDIEDMVTTLSEGGILSNEEAVTLGNTCVEAAQYFNRSEEVSRNDAIGVFKKLNGLVFNNTELGK